MQTTKEMVQKSPNNIFSPFPDHVFHLKQIIYQFSHHFEN